MKKPGSASKKKSAVKKRTSSIPVQSFPIVAIGASAGGLEAIISLLEHLPANTGMAFIYAQHLSPDHESILTSLLANNTKMKVREVTNGMRIDSNCVYVMPPNKEMRVTDGHIKLSPRPLNRHTLLIDKFFISLAETHKENVIGIILSGSATDGTQGLKAIKHEGGLTIVQDDTAKFNSMPKSAIAAGIVDFILSPAEIALELVRLSKHPFIPANGNAVAKEGDIDNDSPEFKTILHLLHKASGVDFRLYKINTIKRRILRRMILHRLKSLKEYKNFLTEKKEETDILFQDLLITVTNFFRDPDASGYLKNTLLPRLLKNKLPGNSLRIWVPACSSGEEAYSLAMMLTEIKDTKFINTPIQIFATDLNVEAVNKARIATYTKQEVENVSPKRLQRFFTKSDGGYRIAQSIREMCVFAAHNILSDPPFSHIDLISCCNLLIYFDTGAQKRAMTTFHYALNPGGYLLLSKSESIGASTQLFSTFNNKYKIYLRRINSGAGVLPKLDASYTKIYNAEAGITEPAKQRTPKVAKNDSADTGEFNSTIDAILLSGYVPASVVINQHMEILQFRGHTDPYLTHPAGKATLNILKIIRSEISFELRNAITKALKTKHPVRKEAIELNEGKGLVTIEVVPVKSEWDERLFLILFSEQQARGPQPEYGRPNKSHQFDRKLKRQEEEITAYRDELRIISENHEAAIEELQSANEEVVSSNEELRSINEELETSKEEIQSASEELASTNQELKTRNELLNESYNYSEAIIATIHEPMVILDKQLRVKTANNAFYRTFSVTEEQTEGIEFYDLSNKQWNIPQLREKLETTITKRIAFFDFEVELTFAGIGKKIMRLNAKPILQPAHREQLISLAIYDVTEIISHQRYEKAILENKLYAQQKISEAIRIADEHIRNIFMQAPVSIIVYKGDSFTIDLINEKGLEMWRTTYKKAMNKPFFEALPDARNQGLEEILKTVFETKEAYVAREFPLKFERKGIVDHCFFSFVVKPVYDLQGTMSSIAAIITDVTLEVVARKKIEVSEQRYSSLTKAITSVVWISDRAGYFTEPQGSWEAYTGQQWKRQKGWGWMDMIMDDDRPIIEKLWRDAIALQREYKIHGRVWSRAFHSYRHFEATGIPLKDDQGNVNEWVNTITDNHDQTIAENKIQEAARQFHFIADSMPQKVWTADARGNINYFNQKWLDYTGLNLEELKGWEWKKAVHPDDWQKTFDRWKYSIETGNYFEIENRLLAKNGSYQWHLSRGESFRDEDGTIKMWVGTNTEIQKQKLQSLEFQNAVRHRTEDLHQANQTLEERNNALKKVNKELESFAYVSSHDLQEPLRKIQIFVNRIRKTETDNLSVKGREDFDRVLAASTQMQTLIEDLLIFARLGIVETKIESVNLEEIINDIKEELKDTIEEKKATIEVRELCKAKIVRFQFHQLMQNLISNSLKFADESRPPHIIIEGKNIEGGHLIIKNQLPLFDYCHIRVTDNGIGFEQEFAEQVFEVFQRLHDKADYPGTGIGLAIAKKIVENHNGIITATSKLNQGTQFDIYFPM